MVKTAIQSLTLRSCDTEPNSKILRFVAFFDNKLAGDEKVPSRAQGREGLGPSRGP